MKRRKRKLVTGEGLKQEINYVRAAEPMDKGDGKRDGWGKKADRKERELKRDKK